MLLTRTRQRQQIQWSEGHDDSFLPQCDFGLGGHVGEASSDDHIFVDNRILMPVGDHVASWKRNLCLNCEPDAIDHPSHVVLISSSLHAHRL